MLDRRKAKQIYRNVIHEKGVFAIRNTKNGKVFLGGSLNLYNFADRYKFRLNSGNPFNERLQKDWNTFGEEAFAFEILEKLKLKDDFNYNYDEDLKILELIWVDKFRPLPEKTYNERENIRIV
jgi:hypothetical protein